MKRILLIAGLVVAPGALAAPQVTAGGEGQAAAGLESLLTLKASELPSADDLAVALLDAGPERAGAFMGAFEARAMAIGAKDPALPDLAALSRRIKAVPAVIERALGHSGIPGAMRNDGVAVALEVARRDPRPASVDLVVRVLGRADGAAASGPAVVASRLTPFVTRSMEAGSLGRVQAAALLRAAPGVLTPSIVDGIARGRGTARAAGLLVELMSEFDGDLDPILLNRVESIARRGTVRLDETLCAVVRRRLDSEVAFIRQEAALAAGAIGDQRAVARLIELLEDETSSVRDVSHSSLRSLTSMTISADPFRWREWHARQTHWWDERGRLLLTRLPEAPLGELIDLVAEISTKRLFRDEVAAALVPLLRHTDARYVEVVLAALVNLRAPAAIPEISRLRVGGDRRLQRLATDALRALKAAGVEVDIVLDSPARPPAR